MPRTQLAILLRIGGIVWLFVSTLRHMPVMMASGAPYRWAQRNATGPVGLVEDRVILSGQHFRFGRRDTSNPRQREVPGIQNGANQAPFLMSLATQHPGVSISHKTGLIFSVLDSRFCCRGLVVGIVTCREKSYSKAHSASDLPLLGPHRSSTRCCAL